MTTKPAALRAEPHQAVGETIQRDAGVILQRWAERAKAEQPNGKRVHHDVLLDHLPTFLWELGRSLAKAGDPEPNGQGRTAEVHGDQRWVAGWSINEVVRDYQLLRIVLVEYLEEALDRPLGSREVMALGVSVDDAIEASVAAYAACQTEAAADGTGAKPPDASPDGLYNVLGFLGHELRNPLAPIGNAIQILRVAATNPDQVEKTRRLLERQFRVMTRLVEDLMDLPRLARGKLSLKLQRLDLSRLVRECAEDRRAAFAESGLRLTIDIPTTPVWTSGDATRLAQAFGNLLNNAQKFTDRGGEVIVKLAADPVRHLAELSVRDSGIGIDPTFLPKVFETFMQAERSLDRSRGGLGLGLALVKGIVELHGGAVRVASDGPGSGAEFTVELPLLNLPGEVGPTGEKAEGAAATSRRILLVEDNRDSAESLRMYLELVGHHVTVTHTGPDGLKAAAATLRKDPALARTLLIALSGHGSDGSRERAAAAGFDLFLVKPVDPEYLAKLIDDPTPTDR
jgi:signal transduction histidine kinase/CheY-like chemotaxis protein